MAFKGRRGKARPVDVRDVEVPEFAKEETEELVDVEEGEISEYREKNLETRDQKTYTQRYKTFLKRELRT